MELNDNILVVGDFNLPGIKWKKSSSNCLFPDLSCSSITQLTSSLLDGYSTAGAFQLNNILNANERTLDLCFASSEIVKDCSISEAPSPLVKLCIHHPPLHITIRQSIPCAFSSSTESIYYDYSKTDYSSMNDFFANIAWYEHLDQHDINSAASSVSNILLYAVDQFVPKMPCKVPACPAWTNNSLKRLKAAKRSALRKLAKSRTDHMKAHYISINCQYKRLNKKLFCAYERRVQQKLKSNPKGFWKHVNQQRKETGLPTVMTHFNNEASSTKGICRLFREQFNSVFTNENLDCQQISEAANNVPCLSSIGPHPNINCAAVKEACSKLKNSTNPGPDGIPAIVLKNCSTSLSLPLSLLFNLSLRSGIFPSCWKKSYVFPVFKKGSKREVSNYRGIAALCAISKLFETLVLDFIMHSCSSYIVEEQHGFIPKRSTSTNLLVYTSFISRGLQRRQQIDAIYTDLSAAFDKINHKIAIAKLERLGFNGSFLRWLESYLTGREMSVKIGDTSSTPFHVTSGVPQGSHLGPIIFLLYLNDVNFSLECLKLSYADDFKLFAIIRCRKDAIRLQRQLNIFFNWCKCNRMVLNASKCSTITFSRKRTNICFDYNIDGITLTKENAVKDLGIVLDSKLTFKDHVAYVTSKASKMLGFVFRVTRGFKNIQCLKTLYCALVRSTLEYSSVVWAPYYQNSIQRIETVQRKFVRFALRHLPWTDRLNLPSYEDRCKLIGLDLLCVRRDVAKATLVADLIVSKINCSSLLRQLNFDNRRRTLRSNTFLRIPVARTNYGHHEPILSMCRIFNRCSNVFDFHLSRSTLKSKFTQVLSHP